MAAVILLTREQHVLVSAAAGVVVYAAAVVGLALIMGWGDRRRPARMLSALVRPAR
jgi:hypothetical protein